ncbi:MAG TPA: hypothetical protein VED40_17860 [Azospirillaceae bacterium]|nr:hypothetical protein [Azospirillaceae bacterium]
MKRVSAVLAAALLLTAGAATAQQPQQPAAPKPAAPAAAPATPQSAPQAAPQKISCVPPKDLPVPPDGRKATEAEMQSARVAFQAYVDQGQNFVDCIETVQQSNGGTLSVADYLRLVKIQDDMIGNMQLLAARFNEQLRLFRTKGQ